MNILITTSSFSANDFDNRFTIINNPYKKRLTEEQVAELILKYQPVAIIAGVEPLTKYVLSKSKNLKVISRVGIGVDSVDLLAAKRLGITVVNTPDAPTQAVAEYTVGMMIAVLRKIVVQDKTIRNNQGKGPTGYLLHGKTVGIIGCGRIGSRVAKILTAFGCLVVGYNHHQKKHDLITMVTLEELLKTSDIVTLHVPLTSKTKNILSKERLLLMKENAILINIARGGLVDEKTLYQLLKKEYLYGAALDCFEKEPYQGPFTSLHNVVLSSHMGSSTKETRVLMEEQAISNMMSELKVLFNLT